MELAALERHDDKSLLEILNEMADKGMMDNIKIGSGGLVLGSSGQHYDGESILETLNVMADKEMMEDIRLGKIDVEMGRLVSCDKVFSNLLS